MKIAILGYGVEGESVYKYYHKKYPEAEFVAYDNNREPKNALPEGVAFVGGVQDFKGISADIAVKTPAIAPWLVDVTGELTTMTREFMKVCPAPVIGVTGTKGKGTTSSLIASILNAAGKKTWLVGNIGVGAFDILEQIKPEDIVVYELSSFQLWDLDVSPHVAVVLGIEPEHLDVHEDFDDYIGAKANIAKHQSVDDHVIFFHRNTYAESIANVSNGVKTGYPRDVGAHVHDGDFYYGDQKLCPVSTLQLPGVHNQENACAAIEACWFWVQDKDMIAKGLGDFSGLPHRLKFVREVDGVSYYDDSIATTPGSAIAALAAFEQPKVIILGGSYKGATYDDLADAIARSSVRKVVLIGEEAPKIEASLVSRGFSEYDNLGASVTMADIVARARSFAQDGDVVILSPSCASFDMFKSYSDRGDQFIAAVQSLYPKESQAEQ